MIRQALLALTAVITCVWFVPAMPEGGLDPSWQFALNQAVADGLRFGEDVTFSFGPYVSVFTQLYHPETATLTLAANLYLAASLWLGLAMLGAGKRLWMLVALCSGILALRFSRDAQLFLPALIAGLVAHRYVIGVPGAPVGWRSVVGIALTFAPLGLLPLIKGSSLVLVLAIVGTSAAALAVTRQWTSAAAVVVAPAGAILSWWVVAGQSLDALPNYVRGIAEMSAGYAAAMSVPGDPGEVVGYLIVSAALLLFCLFLGGDSRPVGRSLLIATLAAHLFIAFKAGFVRHDAVHAPIASGSLLLAALCLPLVVGWRGLAIVALAIWLFVDSDGRHGYQSAEAVRRAARAAPVDIAAAWTHWRLADGWPLNQYRSVLAAIDRRAGLPRLSGPVDTYSYHQADLLATGLPWSPRPTVQSYAAYAPELAARNRDHLLGDTAPRHVVFRVEPIDGRLPPLEDGASWPTLLSHYVPTVWAGESLILDRREEITAPANLPPIQVAQSPLGASIQFPSGDTPLFAQIDVRPTLLGQLVSFLYKPGAMSISLALKSGEHKTYRLIPGMAAAGFVISPLIEGTGEFAMLFARPGLLANKMVSSIVVQPSDGTSALWQATYTVTVHRLPTPAAADLTDVLNFRRFSPTIPADSIVEHACEGHIDRMNGLPVQPTTTAGPLRIDGWLAISLEPVEMPDAVYVVLTDGSGQRSYARAEVERRPDVATTLKAPALTHSGFSLAADLVEMPGSYTLQMALQRGRQLLMCSRHRVPLEIRGEL